MDMKASPLALLKDTSLLKTDALIGGQWVKGSTRFDVLDPATGLKLADVANLGPLEAEQAIAAAMSKENFLDYARRPENVELRRAIEALNANLQELTLERQRRRGPGWWRRLRVALLR